ncbi:MAG: hypothetical protein Q9195_002063 [Heterodermia aff. obscurata]
MVFTSPAWVPELPFDPPDSIPISEFMLNEKYGRHPLARSKPPFTCGLTGAEYSAAEVRDRVDKLARALSQELAWTPNGGTEWDKVAGVFSVNTIDTLTLTWAIHRLSGISTPANAAYSRFELVHQLKSSGAKALFTCVPLLSLALEAASECGIPRKHVYLLPVAKEFSGAAEAPTEFKTVDQLIELGDGLPPLEKLRWAKGQGARQTALLCYSSGTSGLPVPPIIIAMTKNKPLCSRYDLSSVTGIFTGAAPLGQETAEELLKQYPGWRIRQGYGMTETSTVVLSTAPDDIWFGSSGSLLPAVEAKLLAIEGTEIIEHDKPGELVIKSPSNVLGYLNNEAATKETFQDGWVRTGDEAVVRVGPKGTQHIFIVDRIKELIKVKGFQVAPAELEAHLLTHPAVADAAVIPVPDDVAGELPKAFIVKSSSVGLENNDRLLIRDIQKHVEKEKARHKWLKGGVEFIDVIPKSPSGKILRRMLRDKERENRRQKGPKL